MGAQISSEPIRSEPTNDRLQTSFVIPESRVIKTKEDTLSNILSFISINDNRKDYMEHFETIRNLMLNKLQENPAFKSLYNGHDLAGSYADGLKVVKPDEFDFHIYLRLREFNLIDIETAKDFPGQVNLNIKHVLNKIRNMYQYADVYKVLSKLIDEDHILLPKLIQSWLEGLIVKVLNNVGNTFTISGNRYYLRYIKSGPAHTLEVTVNQRDAFSIDFVPVIKVFVEEHWPSLRDPVKLDANNFWVAVAKPKENTSSFQTSFEFMERQLIKSKYNLKAVDRLLKKMRDRQGLTNLKSYYIKTVCLWQDAEVSKDFWSKSLQFVFSKVFEKLLSFCEDEEMPFFWDEEQNMFDKLNFDQKKDIYRKLLKIDTAIKSCSPKELAEVFLTKDEMELFKKTVPE